MSRIAFEVPQNYILQRDRDFLKLVWHIECDSDQTLQSVRTLTGVPFIGAASPLAANLFAVKIRFAMQTPRYFRAEAEYSTRTWESSASDTPDDRPPEIRYFDDTEMVPLEFCYGNSDTTPQTPVLNSAGDPFPDPPLIPKLRQRIEITWYASNPNLTALRGCANTLNRNSIVFDGITYAAQTLWCVRAQTTEKTDSSGNEYTRIDLTFRYNPENWNCRILQSGFNAKDTSGRKYPIRLYNGSFSLTPNLGSRVADPVLLDASGHLLPSGAAAVYGEFRVHPLADWSSLNIPSVQAVHRLWGE